MSRLTWDGTAESVSRDQILRHERGQGSIHFPFSADHEQDWQPYLVDPYSCYMCNDTYIHTYIMFSYLTLLASKHKNTTIDIFMVSYYVGTSTQAFFYLPVLYCTVLYCKCMIHE